MHSFTIAETGSSDQMWTWIQAGQALDDAIRTIEATGAALVSLTADTGWASDGVRALNQKLLDFQTRAGTEAWNLRSRAWELDRIVS